MQTSTGSTFLFPFTANPDRVWFLSCCSFSFCLFSLACSSWNRNGTKQNNNNNNNKTATMILESVCLSVCLSAINLLSVHLSIKEFLHLGPSVWRVCLSDHTKRRSVIHSDLCSVFHFSSCLLLSKFLHPVKFCLEYYMRN